MKASDITLKRFIIDIGHPANVHLFRYFFREIESRGWQGLFAVVDKEVTRQLLDAHDLPYRLLGKNRAGWFAKITAQIGLMRKFFLLAKEFRPIIVLSRGSLYSSVVTRLLKIPHLEFSDTENAGLMNRISYLLVSDVLTGESFKVRHGRKQLRYPGYHELAYLHPNRFIPDDAKLRPLDLKPGEEFAIIRFVAWTAHHDAGHSGISETKKIKLVQELSHMIKVFISAEGPLPAELEPMRVRIKPEHMHDVLNQAKLFVGESATMASECAVLGTPAIYLDNVGRGYTDEQQRSYGLVFNFTEAENDQNLAIEKALELARTPDLRQIFREKRQNLLRDKIDVTAFFVWFVDNYPLSRVELRRLGFSFDRFKVPLGASDC